MQIKKTISISIFILFLSSAVYASNILGTYTYDLDTVLSIMELSLVENGVDPNSEEFKENVSNLRTMISAFGEEEFVQNMIIEAPFSSIEINEDSLILHLRNGNFNIPVEIVKNAIYSRDTESLNEILGYFENNKLFFNFLVTYDNLERSTIGCNNEEFYLIPFTKEV
ncbi:MAG: hypothetical protein ACPKNR_00240 [Pleomorphochaeta sp.]